MNKITKKLTLLSYITVAVLMCGCKNTESKAVAGNYGGEVPSAVLMNVQSIRASIKAGVSLTDEQAAVVAQDNLAAYKDIKDELIEAVNSYRNENNLEKLKEDDTLSVIAMHRTAENAHMEWMETITDEDGTIHHIRPDGSYISTAYSYYKKYGEYGEILGRRQKSVSDVIEAWKNSPQHNSCMLSDEFMYIGAGVAYAENGDIYYAVEFMK